MSIIISLLETPRTLPILRSFLSVDVDRNAERLMVMNRNTGELISAIKKPASNACKIILKEEYSLSSDLMCIILDDNSEFSAAIADNVKPTLIDLVTFDPLNPLPYEPPVA